MEFHPFKIELLKKTQKGNDLIFCEKENDIDDNTVSLISYRTNRFLGIEKFYVGDVYYIEKSDDFIIFTLNKQYINSKGINSCQFGVFSESHTSTDIDYDFSINHYSTIDNVIKKFGKNEKILEYVGNVFIHEDINVLLNKYAKDYYEIPVLDYFIKNEVNDKRSVFCQNNFNFLICYEFEDGEVHYKVFSKLKPSECFKIKQTNWGITLSTPVNLYEESSSEQKLMLSCIAGDCFKFKKSITKSIIRKKIIEDIEIEEEKIDKIIDSFINTLKSFFVIFDAYKGKIKYISTTKNNVSVEYNPIFLFHPKDTEIYEQIECDINDLEYAECLIEVI